LTVVSAPGRPYKWKGIPGLSPAWPSSVEPEYFRSANIMGVTESLLIATAYGDTDPPRGVGYFVGAILFEKMAAGEVVERVLLDLLLDRVGYEIPLEGGWNAYGLFLKSADGELVCSELSIFPGANRRQPRKKSLGVIIKPDELEDSGWLLPGRWQETGEALDAIDRGGIGVRMVRDRIPLEAMKSRIPYWTSFATSGLQAALLESGGPEAHTESLRASAERLSALDVQVTRPGKAGQRDGYYALWAWRVQQARVNGSRRPNVDVAAQYDLRPSQIRDLIFQARDRSLFTKSGELTAAGQEALKAYLAETNGTEN